MTARRCLERRQTLLGLLEGSANIVDADGPAAAAALDLAAAGQAGEGLEDFCACAGAAGSAARQRRRRHLREQRVGDDVTAGDLGAGLLVGLARGVAEITDGEDLEVLLLGGLDEAERAGRHVVPLLAQLSRRVLERGNAVLSVTVGLGTAHVKLGPRGVIRGGDASVGGGCACSDVVVHRW